MGIWDRSATVVSIVCFPDTLRLANTCSHSHVQSPIDVCWIFAGCLLDGWTSNWMIVWYRILTGSACNNSDLVQAGFWLEICKPRNYGQCWHILCCVGLAVQRVQDHTHQTACETQQLCFHNVRFNKHELNIQTQHLLG